MLQTQEAWLVKVQQSFLELERMEIKHQKNKKQQAKEICHGQEKRDEEQQQLRQRHRRQDEVRNTYKVREIEESSFYSYVQNLKDLISGESKKKMHL